MPRRAVSLFRFWLYNAWRGLVWLGFFFISFLFGFGLVWFGYHPTHYYTPCCTLFARTHTLHTFHAFCTAAHFAHAPAQCNVSIIILSNHERKAVCVVSLDVIDTRTAPATLAPFALHARTCHTLHARIGHSDSDQENPVNRSVLLSHSLFPDPPPSDPRSSTSREKLGSSSKSVLLHACLPACYHACLPACISSFACYYFFTPALYCLTATLRSTHAFSFLPAYLLLPPLPSTCLPMLCLTCLLYYLPLLFLIDLMVNNRLGVVVVVVIQ